MAAVIAWVAGGAPMRPRLAWPQHVNLRCGDGSRVVIGEGEKGAGLSLRVWAAAIGGREDRGQGF